MSLIPDLSEIPELGPVEEGEYDLRITFAEEKTFDSGSKAINMCLEIVGEDDADDVWHKVWLPTPLDDAKKVMNKNRSLKEFCDGVGVSTPVESAKEFVDITFSGYLVLVPDFRDENKQVNELKRLT